MESAPDDHGPPASTFSGQTVVFTGKLASVDRRAARALVARMGGVAADEVTELTTMLVVGSEGPPRALRRSVDANVSVSDSGASKSNKLKRAEAVNSTSSDRIQILTEDDFCQLASLRSTVSLERRYHSLRRIRERYPLIREVHLRYLEKWGLVRPVARTNTDTYYSFSDVAILKQVSDELQQNCSFREAVRRRLAAREGQLVLDFSSLRSDARPAKVIALRRREATKIAVTSAATSAAVDGAKSALAARFFLEGSELDEGAEADQERARMAYRKALLLDPSLVPAIVNLANLHYANDDLVEAQALYGRALMLDPECFEAYFNLGNIDHDLGRYQDAVAQYNGALRLNPTYADAHFYIAVTLEKMERSKEAKIHWRAYQQLAPDGEWFELAKEFSE